MNRCLVGVCLAAGGLLVAAGSAAAATVAAGHYHTVVVDGSGNVWAWGRNTSGQLGNGTTTSSTLPMPVSGLTGVIAVAAGQAHTLALGLDGRVWAWGANSYGEVGDGTTTMRTAPVNVLSGVSKIAAGDYHSVAWKIDGTVYTWGYNNGGQLGDGTTVGKSTPQLVPGLSGVSAIAAGRFHTLAVKMDGTAWAWGANVYGELGDSTQTSRYSPTPVSGLTGISLTAVAGGMGHSLALAGNGLVYAWGLNTHGQVGDGTAVSPRLTPTRVAGISGIVALAAGAYHSAAVEGDGSVWGWGRGSRGELGTGSTSLSLFPVSPASGPVGIVQIAASGGQHTVALASDGTIWAWGANGDGPIGDGTTLDRLTPVKVSEAGYAWKVGTPVFSVVPGVYMTTQSVALSCVTPGATIHYTTDGTDPTPSSALYSSPISVTATTTIKARAYKAGIADSNVAVGAYTLRVQAPNMSPGGGSYSTPQTVTLSSATPDATLYYTTDGTPPSASSSLYTGPLSLTGSTTLLAFATKGGWSDSYTAGASYAFNFGTLAAPNMSPGAGTSLESVEVTLSGPQGATIRYTTNGTEPTGASTLYTGPITLTATATLKAKAFQADWTESATAATTYTLEAAAPTLSPGAGTYPIGQTVTLGCTTPGATIYYTLDGTDPTTSDAGTPSGGAIFVGDFTLKARAYVSGMSPSAITSANYLQSGTPASGAVAAGAAHSLVLKPDGSLWAWGSNNYGQLGDATTTQRLTPVPVTSMSGVAAIAAGASHSLVLRTDGTVWSFGSNGYGQLGVGATPSYSSTPVPVTSLSGVVAVAAGANHSLAITSDGRVWSWGYNFNGQLGDGTTANKNTPIAVAIPGVPAQAVTAIAGGASHSLAVRGDGTLWAWGANSNGQLGDATTTQRTQAVQVSGLTGVTAVAAGGAHSLALKTDGTAWAWGYNLYGQLGTGDYTQYTTPQGLIGLPGPTRLEAGQYFSLALASDWLVSAWGSGNALGNGTTSSSAVPLTLWTLPPIVAVAAGDNHGLALGQDGSVWSWGTGTSGQLGDGMTIQRLWPVPVAEAGFTWKAGTPTFNYSAGTYSTTFNVAITTVTAGATVYYTTDGTTPTTGSPLYGGPVSITQTTTLMAKAVKAGLADSNVGSAAYTLQAAAPGVSPAGGTFSADKTVTLTCSSPGVTIRYTTNGLDPTPSDPGITSGQTVIVSQSLTLKASAWRTGWTTSTVSTASFTMKPATPTLSPNGGVFAASQNVTVSTTTAGAVIHYTTSGLEPTESDPIVESASTVPVAQSATLKAKAFRGGWTPSDTASAGFIVNLGAVAAPVFSPAAGTYTEAQSVTLSTTTGGAVVRYTLDGADPTPASPLFAAPIPVAATTTIKARAYRADGTPSALASATYTINAGAVEAPGLDVASGAYSTRRTVTITCATAGATIRYTTNGLDPAPGDATIASGGTILVDRSMVVKAAAWKEGMTTSAVTRRDYLVTGAIAASGNHTLALKADGSVWSWGWNNYGQLGDTTTTNRNSPVAVVNLTDVVAIAAGGYHSLALKADGSVWAWGYNANGQLGDNSTVNKSAPVQVSGLSGAVAIAAGQYHSLALLSSGTVKAWGYNQNGQLGDNSTTQRTSPVTVANLTTAAAIAAGVNHSLALKTDGTAVGWGSNAQGQLGAATPTQSLVPMAVPNLSGITRIAAGTSFSFVLRTGGMPSGGGWGFGLNTSGQLGEGTLVTKTSPVGGPLELRWVVAGDRHGVGVRQDGSIVAWGANDAGQLGDGSLTGRPYPVGALGVAELLQLGAGNAHTVGLRADGTIWGWGSGAQGQLGQGSSSNSSTALPVPGFTVASNGWMNEDTDLDGLTNAAEYRLGTDPLDPDTNRDGIPDGWELGVGGGPASPDTDSDGLWNWIELEKGTDPFLADTDGDGVLDGADCYPLDPTQTACGTPDPGDTTPPLITLTEPPGAVLIP